MRALLPAIPPVILPVILTALVGAGCAPKDECALTSTVPGYVPACEAWLVRYPDESRLFVDEILVAYLPREVTAATEYGGTSGNPLTVLLGERLAEARPTTVTFGASLSEVWLDATFEDGQVIGPVTAGITTGE